MPSLDEAIRSFGVFTAALVVIVLAVRILDATTGQR
jgi:hypothetical protein